MAMNSSAGMPGIDVVNAQHLPTNRRGPVLQRLRSRREERPEAQPVPINARRSCRQCGHGSPPGAIYQAPPAGRATRPSDPVSGKPGPRSRRPAPKRSRVRSAELRWSAARENGRRLSNVGHHRVFGHQRHASVARLWTTRAAGSSWPLGTYPVVCSEKASRQLSSEWRGQIMGIYAKCVRFCVARF